MRYTVTMSPAAGRDLARIWMSAPDRVAVSRAANHIDQTLRDAPLSEASPFFGRWVMISAPLGIVFNVDHGDCKG